MRRSTAERLGLLPVTISRCPRAFEDNAAVSAPHFLFLKEGPGGLRSLFPPQNYMLPKRDSWTGSLHTTNERGEKVIAFWPQWFA